VIFVKSSTCEHVNASLMETMAGRVRPCHGFLFGDRKFTFWLVILLDFLEIVQGLFSTNRKIIDKSMTNRAPGEGRNFMRTKPLYRNE